MSKSRPAGRSFAWMAGTALVVVFAYEHIKNGGASARARTVRPGARRVP